MISKKHIHLPVECFYCGIEILTKWEHTYDHFIPLSRGGENDFSNLVECCKKCNSDKADKIIEEWLPEIEHKLMKFQEQSPNHPALEKYKILSKNLKDML